MNRLALLALLPGCGLGMSDAQPWVPIDAVAGPLVAELAGPGTLRTHRTAPSNPLRVVTYNFEYGPDPDGLAAALLDTPALATAGVVLVQEVESYPAEGRSRTAIVADQLGFNYVYVPAREVKDGGTHGLSILSAFPITDVSKMDLRESANKSQHRIAIQATIDVDGTPVHVIDVHLDTKLNTAQRIAQLSPIVMSAPETTLIAGDFNMSWVEWVDGKLPVLSSTRASDQAPVVDGYMRDQGFETPTAGSGNTEHMFGLEQRLDAIYTRELTATFGGVEHVGPSDHWPLWIDLTLQ
ncbi:MAG: endonuclease/exonuclease/phosphatase family protein [Myxococcales bacterium]|nr:endonuclease/exonuclease/phosphatase family protein [Myxococcales bacterium]